MTTINPNILERLRIAEAFAISGVLALAGRTKIAKILTAAGFVLLIIILFAVWQETYPR